MLDVPGHTAGHVAYWREADRSLILGDVLFGMNPLTGLRHCASRRTSSRSTPRRTASRRASWPRWSRRWSASGTARRERDTKRFTDFIAGLPRD